MPMLDADDPWLGCNMFSEEFRNDPHPSLHVLRARLREMRLDWDDSDLPTPRPVN